MKLIKNWEELTQVPPNDKFKIEVDLRFHNGWILPIKETKETLDNYFENHCYLHTHSFYGNWYQDSTKTLQKYGFDIEIDNWDKEVIEDEFR